MGEWEIGETYRVLRCCVDISNRSAVAAQRVHKGSVLSFPAACFLGEICCFLFVVFHSQTRYPCIPISDHSSACVSSLCCIYLDALVPSDNIKTVRAAASTVKAAVNLAADQLGSLATSVGGPGIVFPQIGLVSRESSVLAAGGGRRAQNSRILHGNCGTCSLRELNLFCVWCVRLARASLAQRWVNAYTMPAPTVWIKSPTRPNEASPPPLPVGTCENITLAVLLLWGNLMIYIYRFTFGWCFVLLKTLDEYRVQRVWCFMMSVQFIYHWSVLDKRCWAVSLEALVSLLRPICPFTCAFVHYLRLSAFVSACSLSLS